jgi:hypothetical protein
MSDPTEGDDLESTEPVASAVDETQRKRRESKIKRKQREDREFFRLVLASEAGRRFLWSILAECHTFETIFGSSPAGAPDPLASWLHLGEQQIGQRLYQLWHFREPKGVMDMLHENDPRFAEVVI